MSEAIVANHPSRTESSRGQTLVEFALVLPMLLVMLLGIADFGRVFAAGITVEAISRDAAEAASQEYLQFRRAASPAAPSSTAYDAVFARAEEVACEEAGTLANVAVSGGNCAMPVIGTCVHDQWGDHCSSTSSSPPRGLQPDVRMAPRPDGSAGRLAVREGLDVLPVHDADESH
jgi:hypothetical protein